MGPPRTHVAFFESPAPVPLRKVQLKTRSSDRYKIAHLSPRNPNFQDGELVGRPSARTPRAHFKVKRKDGAQG